LMSAKVELDSTLDVFLWHHTFWQKRWLLEFICILLMNNLFYSLSEKTILLSYHEVGSLHRLKSFSNFNQIECFRFQIVHFSGKLLWFVCIKCSVKWWEVDVGKRICGRYKSFLFETKSTDELNLCSSEDNLFLRIQSVSIQWVFTFLLLQVQREV
jgi:hypothetical protein